MAVSKRTRFEVLRRDGHRCRYCGNEAAEGAALTIDHVVPVTLGGGDDPSNLVAACKDCNAGKSSTSPDGPVVADVAADALRWAAAMRAARELMVTGIADRQEYTQTFHKAWKVWIQSGAGLPNDWVATVLHWQEDGLPIEVLTEAVDIAMAARVPLYRVFRYLCGIVHNRFKEMQDHASRLIEAGSVGETNL